MSVTQYIGARYVPLFADPLEWDSTREYEPLTIVIHQGASYTSRQAVPVGIDINNEAFWALTGNYNAQVEAYRREVREYDGRITANTEAIATEADRRETADAQLTSDIEAEAAAREAADNDLRETIENDVQTAINSEKAAREAADAEISSDNWVTTNRINNSAVTSNKIANNAITSDKIADGSINLSDLNSSLVSRIINNSFTNDFFVFISDSYGCGVGGTDGQGWTYHTAKNLNLNATQYVDISNSGAGFVAKGHSEGLVDLNYKMQIDYAASNLPSGKTANDVTYLIIGGGYNDHGRSGVETAAYQCVRHGADVFPNAKIIFYPLCAGDREINAEFNGTYSAMSIGAAKAGAQVYQEAVYWLNPYQITKSAGDQIHPNADGYAYIGAFAAATINGGYIPPFTNTYAASAEGFSFASDATNNNFRAGVQNGYAWFGGRIDRKGTGDLCTLPSYLRPRATTYIPVFVYADSSHHGIARLRIQSSGLVNFLAMESGTLDNNLTYQVYIPTTCIPLGKNFQ